MVVHASSNPVSCLPEVVVFVKSRLDEDMVDEGDGYTELSKLHLLDSDPDPLDCRGLCVGST